MEPVERQGFVWGQIYIVLSIVFGIIGLVYGIMGLVADTGPTGIALGTGVAWGVIVGSALQLFSGIGIWGKWKWGLWLVYLLCFVHIIISLIGLVMFYIQLATAVSGEAIAGRTIASLIYIGIWALYWVYFYRRRALFR